MWQWQDNLVQRGMVTDSTWKEIDFMMRILVNVIKSTQLVIGMAQ